MPQRWVVVGRLDETTLWNLAARRASAVYCKDADKRLTLPETS